MSFMNVDLITYSEAAQKEGFCLLHTGGGVSKQTQICMDPVKKTAQLPGIRNGQAVHIGYVAYPNPKLNNEIPDSRFFEFRKSRVYNHGKKLTIKPFHADFRTSGRLEQNVSKRQYLQKITQIKKWLAAGEVYQLNYAIRFRKKFSGNPYHFFLKWIKEGGANFSAYLNCGDFQVLSNSPERLFRVEKNLLMTQPIKGTAPKSEKMALQKLLRSEKERAELDMITDLERNDVGKLCKYGSLRLSKERQIMELPNLYHTYSEVRGTLPRGTKNTDIIKAMFPGGSITGCPKKRAMHFIEKLEGLPRNIFTGSILHQAAGRLDASICIRTALVHKGIIEYWAGGGIVADSDPEAEYAECLLKAEKFLHWL